MRWAGKLGDRMAEWATAHIPFGYFLACVVCARRSERRSLAADSQRCQVRKNGVRLPAAVGARSRIHRGPRWAALNAPLVVRNSAQPEWP
jgi:hypothetical protein